MYDANTTRNNDLSRTLVFRKPSPRLRLRSHSFWPSERVRGSDDAVVTAKNYGQAVEGACTLGRRTLAASRDALIEVKYISVRQRFKYGFLYPTIRRYWKYYLYTDLQLIKRHARRLLLWVPSFSDAPSSV